MIETGLVLLVKSNAAVMAIAATGGFLATLPKDYTLPSWTYTVITKTPEYVLRGPESLASHRIQIDCYGNSGGDVVLLAQAIDRVLNGFHGTLPDADGTRVQGAFGTNTIDFFDTASRTYRRMLEYEFWASQGIA